MNKALEVLLTVVALAGLYCAMPKQSSQQASQPGGPAIGQEQAVVIADGTDPMPLCRKRYCTQ